MGKVLDHSSKHNLMQLLGNQQGEGGNFKATTVKPTGHTSFGQIDITPKHEEPLCSDSLTKSPSFFRSAVYSAPVQCL